MQAEEGVLEPSLQDLESWLGHWATAAALWTGGREGSPGYENQDSPTL